MIDNVHGQDEVKGGRVVYRHRSEQKTMSAEGILTEKGWRRPSISEVDVTAATSENGSNIRAAQDRGGI